MKIFEYSLIGEWQAGVLLVVAETEAEATTFAEANCISWEFVEERTDIQYVGDAKVPTIILEQSYSE